MNQNEYTQNTSVQQSASYFAPTYSQVSCHSYLNPVTGETVELPLFTLDGNYGNCVTSQSFGNPYFIPDGNSGICGISESPFFVPDDKKQKVFSSFSFYPQYDTIHEKGEKKMSYFICIKKQSHIVFASDSKNVRSGETENLTYQKIFPFSNIPLLIGVTGLTTFEEREIDEYLKEWVSEIDTKDILGYIEERLRILQKNMPHNFTTTIHLAFLETGNLRYARIELSRACSQRFFAIEGNYQFHSGVEFPLPGLNLNDPHTLEEDVNRAMDTVKLVKAYQKIQNLRPLVGGKVQCFSLEKTGCIRNFSE